jgi:hypothetical protein
LARRLATAGLQLATNTVTHTRAVQGCTRVKFALFRCTSAELFFSGSGRVAAPRQGPEHHDQVYAKNNERSRGHRPKITRAIQRFSAQKHPGNSALHTGKIYSFPLHIISVSLLLLRQRCGAVGSDRAQ